MLICPNGHGPKEGRYCPDCGSELLAAAGDTLRIRSPEAHATVNPTFILPGATGGGGPPALIKCPKCGHRNSEADVFDCQGPCGRINLCRRHFDAEYELCQDCARERRGLGPQDIAWRARLEAELAEWRGRAERAEAQLAALAARTEKPDMAQRPVWEQIGMELVKIPAGEFLCGVDKQKVLLPDFSSPRRRLLWPSLRRLCGPQVTLPLPN